MTNTTDSGNNHQPIQNPDSKAPSRALEERAEHYLREIEEHSEKSLPNDPRDLQMLGVLLRAAQSEQRLLASSQLTDVNAVETDQAFLDAHQELASATAKTAEDQKKRLAEMFERISSLEKRGALSEADLGLIRNPHGRSTDPTPKNASAGFTLDDFFSHDTGATRPDQTRKESAQGPAEGSKKTRNKNALLHGVYSNEIILPWESEDDFKTLHEAFRAEWKPDGYSEEQALFDVTYYTWKKCRLIKAAKLRFFKCSLPEEVKSGQYSWQDLIDNQAKVGEFAERAVRRVWEFIDQLDKMIAHINSHHYWTKDSEGKDVQLQLAILKTDVSDVNSKARTVVIEGVTDLVSRMNKLTGIFEQFYQPDEIERELDLMAKLDACIEKAIRRLTAIKVFKRVDGVEASPRALLSSPPVAPDEIPAAKLIDNSNEHKAPPPIAQRKRRKAKAK